jgi:hypothetical protein
VTEYSDKGDELERAKWSMNNAPKQPAPKATESKPSLLKASGPMKLVRREVDAAAGPSSSSAPKPNPRTGGSSRWKFDDDSSASDDDQGSEDESGSSGRSTVYMSDHFDHARTLEASFDAFIDGLPKSVADCLTEEVATCAGDERLERMRELMHANRPQPATEPSDSPDAPPASRAAVPALPATTATPEVSSAAAFGPGTRVRIHSLQARPEHNGKFAQVLGPQGSDRVQVRLEDGSHEMALKPANLEAANLEAFVAPSGLSKKQRKKAKEQARKQVKGQGQTAAASSRIAELMQIVDVPIAEAASGQMAIKIDPSLSGLSLSDGKLLLNSIVANKSSWNADRCLRAMELALQATERHVAKYLKDTDFARQLVSAAADSMPPLLMALVRRGFALTMKALNSLCVPEYVMGLRFMIVGKLDVGAPPQARDWYLADALAFDSAQREEESVQALIRCAEVLVEQRAQDTCLETLRMLISKLPFASCRCWSSKGRLVLGVATPIFRADLPDAANLLSRHLMRNDINPLHLAVRYGSRSVLRLLLEGIPPDEVPFGPALQIVLESKECTEPVGILEMLINANMHISGDDYEWTSLLDPHRHDDSLCALLVTSCAPRRHDALLLQFQLACAIAKLDVKSFTSHLEPLGEVLRELESSHGVSTLSKRIYPVLANQLDTLVSEEATSLLAALLVSSCSVSALRVQNEETLLHRAAALDRPKAARMMLEKGVSPQMTTASGDTVVHVAVRGNSVAFLEEVLRGSYRLVAKECLTVRNGNGHTPILCLDTAKKSASATRAKAVRRLLEEAARGGGTGHGTARSPKKAPGAAADATAKMQTVKAPQSQENTDHDAPSSEASTPPGSSLLALHKALTSESEQEARTQLRERLLRARLQSVHPSKASGKELPAKQPSKQPSGELPPGEQPSGKLPLQQPETLREPSLQDAGPSSSLPDASGASPEVESNDNVLPAPGGEQNNELVAVAAQLGAGATDDDDQEEPFKFEECAWRVVIVRQAAKQLSSLGPDDCRAALSKLHTLAQGYWHGSTVAKKLVSHVAGARLSLYESKFLKGARIIWEVGIDFAPKVKMYTQTIRVWAVERTHDGAAKAITYVANVYRRGLESVTKSTLRPTTGGNRKELQAPRVHRAHGSELTLPVYYQRLPENLIYVPLESLETLEQLEAEAAAAEGSESDPDDAERAQREQIRYPPAVAQEGAFNLVKFYGLERSLVRAVLSQTFTEKLEFPFLPDEAEHLIIAMSEHKSILLVGRSGTGKTTIVVQRLWLHYQHNYEQRLSSANAETPVLHQLFVTANPCGPA